MAQGTLVCIEIITVVLKLTKILTITSILFILDVYFVHMQVFDTK